MNDDFLCQSRPGEDGSGPRRQDAACLRLSDGLERQRETLTELGTAGVWPWLQLHLRVVLGSLTQKLSPHFSLWGAELTHFNVFTKSIIFRKTPLLE